mgnify:FL=1
MPKKINTKAKGVGKKPTPKPTKKVKKEKPTPYMTKGEFMKQQLESRILLACSLTYLTSVNIYDNKEFNKILKDNELDKQFYKELQEVTTLTGLKGKIKKFLKKINPEYLRQKKLAKFKNVDKDYVFGHEEIFINESGLT